MVTLEHRCVPTNPAALFGSNRGNIITSTDQMTTGDVNAS